VLKPANIEKFIFEIFVNEPSRATDGTSHPWAQDRAEMWDYGGRRIRKGVADGAVGWVR